MAHKEGLRGLNISRAYWRHGQRGVVESNVQWAEHGHGPVHIGGRRRRKADSDLKVAADEAAALLGSVVESPRLTRQKYCTACLELYWIARRRAVCRAQPSPRPNPSQPESDVVPMGQRALVLHPSLLLLWAPYEYPSEPSTAPWLPRRASLHHVSIRRLVHLCLPQRRRKAHTAGRTAPRSARSTRLLECHTMPQLQAPVAGVTAREHEEGHARQSKQMVVSRLWRQQQTRWRPCWL